MRDDEMDQRLARIIREVQGGAPPDDTDALVWMVILCSHRIVLRGGPGTEGCVFRECTQRRAAAVIAALRPDQPRYEEWYWRFNAVLPGPDASCIPRNDPRRARVDELVALLRAHPDVAAVEEER